MYACIHLPDGSGSKLLENCAASFAIEAEATAPGTIVFDISRLNRLYGGPRQIGEAILEHARSLGLHPNVAVGRNAEAALMAARNFHGLTILPEEPGDALGTLDIGNLPLSPQLWDLLESWGVRTFEDFAKLPESGIAERLGPEGVYLHRLARGQVNRPIRVAPEQVTFTEREQLEHALDNLEPLLFILARMLNDQCEKLCAHGFSTNEIRVKLELDNRQEHLRTLRLPVPMRQPKAILKLLQLDLEAHPPQSAILAVNLTLQPVQPRTVQNGIFLPVTPAPDKLEVTLTRIRALVGEENAGVPELLNTHRPAPFRLVTRQPEMNKKPLQQTPEFAPRLAFRYFQPPLSVKVEFEKSRPIRVSGASIRGNILTYAGPWRSSGDWWTENPWNRDEWDISLNDGALYRIYRNSDGCCFIEGTYD